MTSSEQFPVVPSSSREQVQPPVPSSPSLEGNWELVAGSQNDE